MDSMCDAIRTDHDNRSLGISEERSAEGRKVDCIFESREVGVLYEARCLFPDWGCNLSF